MQELTKRNDKLRMATEHIPDDERPDAPETGVHLGAADNWAEKKLNPLNKQNRLMKNGFYSMQTREDICDKIWDLIEAKEHSPKARGRKCSMIGKV